MKPILSIFVCLLILSGLWGCSRPIATDSEMASGPCRNIPLVNAASNHEGLPEVKALLAKGVDVNTVNSCGQTALTRAAALNNVEIVDFLLKHGAKVDVRTSSSATPLVLAASNGNIESAKLLLDHGAAIEAKQSDHTPLIAAVDNHIITLPEHSTDSSKGMPTELLDMERLLINHGANVNAERDGKTALMVAKRRNFVQTITLLKQAGARH